MIEQGEWLAFPESWFFCLCCSYHGLTSDVHVTASLTPLLLGILLLGHFFILISVRKILRSVHGVDNSQWIMVCLLQSRIFFYQLSGLPFIYFRFVSYCTTNSTHQMKYAHIGMCDWTFSLRINETLRIEVFLVPYKKLWHILLAIRGQKEENFLDVTGQERALYTGLSVCVHENKLQYIC